MKNINRLDWLKQLESLVPGLDKTQRTMNSDCFVFGDTRVFTFNDEIMCSCEDSTGIDGVVPAFKLIELLRKLPGDTVNLEQRDGNLLIKQGRRRSKLSLRTGDSGVEEEIGDGKWKDLPDGFFDAVKMVAPCTSKDLSRVSSCVRITDAFMEACDNEQLCRYQVGLDQEVLVRGKSIKKLVGLGLVRYSVSDSWVHFQNAEGLTASCRICAGKFIDLSRSLVVDGNKVELPKNLSTVLATCQVFSDEDDKMKVSLSEGSVMFEGRGVDGWYKETCKVEYVGDGLAFKIYPNLLLEISKRTGTCHVSDSRLIVDGGVFVYVCSQVAA